MLTDAAELRCAMLNTRRQKFDQGDTADAKIALVSHETLAEIVGTTLARITHFMNKFRTMGLIDYVKDGFTVRTELLTDVVLHD